MRQGADGSHTQNANLFKQYPNSGNKAYSASATNEYKLGDKRVHPDSNGSLSG